jgi:hypothetical protein
MGHVWDVFSDEAEISAAGVDLTSDSYQHTDTLFNLMLGSNGLATGQPADHLGFMIDELAYVNIHTDLWPMGEIRCQLEISGTIDAEPQTKRQQKCTAALDKGFGKVSASYGKQIARCVKASAKGKLPGGVEACALPNSHVDDAQAALTEDFDGRCEGDDKNGVSRLPDFGVSDDTIAGDAATAAILDIAHDVFDSDLDESIDDGTDSALGKCQRSVAKGLFKCEAAVTKEFNTCVKDDLNGKVGLHIVDEFGFEYCMEVDRKGKIAASCSADSGKVRRAIDKNCTGVDLSEAMPGCDESAPIDAARCAGAAVTCRSCLARNEANVVDRDCDLLDDGTANLSCDE